MNNFEFYERILPTRRGSNPRPPDHQSDAHPTESPRSELEVVVTVVVAAAATVAKVIATAAVTEVVVVGAATTIAINSYKK